MAKHIKKPVVVAKKESSLMKTVNGIIKSTLKGGKSTVVKHGVSGVVALIISSVVPMLQGWHAEHERQVQIKNVRQEAVDNTKAAEDRVNQSIKDLEDLDNKKFQLMWDVINKEREGGTVDKSTAQN